MTWMNGIDQQWFMDHAGIIFLSAAVTIEWIALQALLIHYHFFRESLKRPTPDGIRFSTIEKVLSFQASQIDRVFGKIGDMSKEISVLGERKFGDRAPNLVAMPGESSVLSLGEVNLKKRLAELRANALPNDKTKLN